MSKVLQLLKLPDGTVKVLVEGQKRVKITSIKNEKSFLIQMSKLLKTPIFQKNLIY